MTTINWPTAITLDVPTVSLIVSIITGIVSTITGITVAFIAIQQWLTNRRQLRLHLFDKRFAVFEATRHFTEFVAHSGRATQEELETFRNATRGVFFLFNNQELQDL